MHVDGKVADSEQLLAQDEVVRGLEHHGVSGFKPRPHPCELLRLAGNGVDFAHPSRFIRKLRG